MSNTRVKLDSKTGDLVGYLEDGAPVIKIDDTGYITLDHGGEHVILPTPEELRVILRDSKAAYRRTMELGIKNEIGWLGADIKMWFAALLRQIVSIAELVSDTVRYSSFKVEEYRRQVRHIMEDCEVALAEFRG